MQRLACCFWHCIAFNLFAKLCAEQLIVPDMHIMLVCIMQLQIVPMCAFWQVLAHFESDSSGHTSPVYAVTAIESDQCGAMVGQLQTVSHRPAKIEKVLAPLNDRAHGLRQLPHCMTAHWKAVVSRTSVHAIAVVNSMTCALFAAQVCW